MARHVKSKTTMSFIARISTLAVVGAAMLVAGCGPMGGESEDIDDLSNKSLKVTHDSVASSGLMVAFDYDDQSQCSVLDSDAFARLNGRSVPLFLGHYEYIPPMGDDGGFNCTHPSVTLDEIPADLQPPWKIEIGDSTQVVSATFGPGTPNTFEVGPLENVTLTSSQDKLDVPITRHPGDTTPAYAAVTSTASDGQTSIRRGDVYQPYIQVLNPVNPGWPAGPVAIQIVVYYYPPDALLGCQNAACTIVSPDYSGGSCDAVPAADSPGCSSLATISTTTALTLELSCASSTGICSYVRAAGISD